MRCPHCGTETDQEYCPTCGYKFTKTQSSIKGFKDILIRIKNSVSLFALLLFIGFLVLNTGIILWSVNWVIPEVVEAKTIIYIVFFSNQSIFSPVGLFSITGNNFLIYFVSLVAAIFLSYIIIFYQGGSRFFSYVSETISTKGKDNPNKDSPIPRLAFVFSALIFLSYLYYMLIMSQGTEPTTPNFESFPLWYNIYSFARAAVWEELTVRVVFLGLPMFIYGIFTYARRKGSSLKKIARYLYGGFGTEERFVAIPIIFSSVVFSLAHLGSWDLYKLPPTFLAGLAFGYIFVKDGLHSAILFHFIWDYLSIPIEVFDFPDVEIYISLLILIWMAVGAYYTYYYSKKSINWLLRTKRKSEEEVVEEVEVERGPKTAGVSSAYSCPNCGNHRAVYTNKGKLQCKRCGYESDPQEAVTQNTVNEEQRQWPPI